MNAINGGWMNERWLSGIIRKIARGRWRVVSACIVTDGDIQQDLLLDAYRDPSFAQRLNALPTESDATMFACRFLNRAWQRRERMYFSKWRRLQ